MDDKEKTEKYIKFTVLIKKNLEKCQIVSYKKSYMDNLRFIEDLPSSLADNVLELL